MEDSNAVDLRTIKKIIIKYKVRLIAIIVAWVVVGIAYAFSLPKEYESTSLLRAKSQKAGGISLQAASALAILSGGTGPSPAQAYMEMMKSRSVLDPIIASLDLPIEQKGKIDAKIFAKNYLKITNTKGTDFVQVTGVGSTPEEAQEISKGVVKSFQELLTKLNQSEQSLMITFLNQRIIVAKKEMEQAEGNLEKFRQQEKIYIPDEQTKGVIKKMTEFDQKIGQIQVLNDTNQMKLKSVTEQLNKQNIALSQYKIADNPSIQQIRSTMIQKQMDLIGMQQHYTKKHPNVILLETELTELNHKLSEEVDNSIHSEGNTLNPIHASLLKDKIGTETEILVGQVALATTKKLQTETEKEISKLSANSITYVGLERQVKIAQEVYGQLLKSYEETRIQEAMESMDIQIIDVADLPQKPSAPNKKLITVIGGVLGIMLSFVYVIVLYCREHPKGKG